ncbi:MAG: hypothetical protein JSW28_08080 [Thermoplasmata archaeon]|nr:MAG: hypothetical protein JSW28_08080 [Thermoplasmata archaeon]
MTTENEARPISYPETAALLHGILFAYEKVVAELYKGKHKILFPYIIEEITRISKSHGLAVMDPNLPLTDKMERLRVFFSNNELLKGVSFDKIDEQTFNFEIDECSFAVAGVHDLLKMHGGVCPFALAFAAILTGAMADERYVDLADSEYTEKGSKTVLKIV